MNQKERQVGLINNDEDDKKFLLKKYLKNLLKKDIKK